MENTNKHTIKESIKQLITEFDADKISYNEFLRKLELKAKRLADKIAQFKATNNPANYRKNILDPICDALAIKFEVFSYELLGPSGLGNSYTLYLWLEEETKDNWDKCLTVSFRFYQPDQGLGSQLGVVDYSVNTKEFNDNSIGAMNGFNHPVLFINDWSVDQLAEFILKQKEARK